MGAGWSGAFLRRTAGLVLVSTAESEFLRLPVTNCFSSVDDTELSLLRLARPFHGHDGLRWDGGELLCTAVAMAVN